MNLETEYLGLKLKHPLIVGASPLADDLDKVRKLEDSGAAAITMYSLFEEQITQNMLGSEAHIGAYENSFAEAASYFPEVNQLLERDVEAYLEQLQKVKSAVEVPVIASLNGTREGEWVTYASLMEQSGADALELNLYFLATDLEESASVLEDRCLRIVEAVRSRISIPLTVKLSPNFTALPHFANRLCAAKVDGLVLFNRFYQPDFDIEDLSVRPSLDLSFSNELRQRLRWLALLSDRISCDLSVSGGVHTGVDAVKAIMAGANSVQMVSTLLINGPARIADIFTEMEQWMTEHEYESVDQMRGCMNYNRAPDPEALERANYMRVLKSWRPKH
ncbi:MULTISPECIES: dihydroorotate dehydrogenase-like protein [unclassified Lentimonas]|uniref:dihydroorotate dehydrogenase-like protein n=1 Tax=unclassified Lentimonas TaxID=2630993 RepID=UPI00132378B8|nr:MULTISPECIES: dihydroorotate dehydrogenase-like protein [unclassified Lentimonas]CAA6677935.1 Dihydroorotate dehydrogenase (EC [Lentimonas sp. CC4]CAA6684039.1 Dihydroorotate dehydrogenase (EC [Lentimonas sp. CC6]CAA6689849.1 Dihydroorotate dehydrogenase (EC [Lentimonas sp. CC10]CAA6697202.1 Dihydroorotate dehydrogenase (EC [Lentimonas sp. CC19]CAA7069453.1 Dihydroorotate dehydrogenase (EC [Lentimonas sp. CC11]